jgi:hypothetical protein
MEHNLVKDNISLTGLAAAVFICERLTLAKVMITQETEEQVQPTFG